MPNRVIREGFLDSESIAAAGEPAECLYHRLLLLADDYGRFDGRATLILNRAWPAGPPDDVDRDEVERRLARLTELELVLRYEHAGKPYILIPRFRQRTRAMNSRYPEPGPAVLARAAQLENGPARASKRPKPSPPDPDPVSRPSVKRPPNGGQPSNVRPLESETETETETVSNNITASDRGGSTSLSPELSPEPPETPETGGIAHKAPRAPADPANGSLDARARAYGMIRLPLESDEDLALRLQARMNLGP